MLLKSLLFSLIYFSTWSLIYWEMFVKHTCYKGGFVIFPCSFINFVSCMLKPHYLIKFDLNYVFLMNWIFHDSFVTLYIYFLCITDCALEKMTAMSSLIPYAPLTMWLWPFFHWKMGLCFGKLVIKEEIILCAFQR